MSMDELDDGDRRMLADLEAQARRARNRRLLRWGLILGPGVPILLLSILFLGMLMSIGTLTLIVVWAVVLEKKLPDLPIG